VTWKSRFAVFDHTSGYTPGFVCLLGQHGLLLLLLLSHTFILNILQKAYVLAKVDGSASQPLLYNNQFIYWMFGLSPSLFLLM
jgi:hypothetical protein